MSSPLFENIFGTYLTDRQLLAEFTGAQVESLQLSRASRFMSEDGLSSPAATKGAVHDDRAKALNMEQLRSGL